MKKFIAILIFLLVQPIVTIHSEELDQSFWGKVTNSQILNIDDFYLHKMTNDRLVLQIGEPRDSTSEIRILNAHTLDEIFTITGLHHFFRVSYGKNPCIIACERGFEEVAKIDIYDLDGEYLFSNGNPVYLFTNGDLLFPSPNGHYFYTYTIQVSKGMFVIYDRLGKKVIINAPTSREGTQLAVTINDSVIALVGDDIILYDVIRKEPILTLINPSVISNENVISYGRGFIRLTDSITSTDWTINNRSEREFASVFNSEKTFLVSCSRVEGKRGINQIELINIKENKTKWADEIDDQNMLFGSPYHIIRIEDNLISLKSSTQVNYFRLGAIDANTFTHVYKIDPSTGELLDKTRLPGIVDILNNSDGSKRVFHVTAVDSGKIMTVYDLETQEK